MIGCTVGRVTAVDASGSFMRRSLTLVIASVLGALVAGLLAFAPSAAVQRALVTGTITGPGGATPAGVVEMRVDLLRKTKHGWTAMRGIVLTEGDTAFSFAVAKEGTFAIRARPKAGPCAAGVSKPFRAGPDRARAGVRVALKRSGAVAGTVRLVPTGTTQRGVVQLWRREKRRWVAGRRLQVPADGRFVFGVRPGTFRITYTHPQRRYWTEPSAPVTVKGRRTASTSLTLSQSKTISGALTRVGFAGRVIVIAQARTSRGWTEVSRTAPLGDTYSLAVPGAKPQVRLLVWGHPEGWHPTIYWDGTPAGTLSARRATVAMLGAGSLTGVDFTLPTYREFVATQPARIMGRARVGSTLRVSAKWSPEPTRVRYQWYRGRSHIKGATASTYRVRKADRGRKVWVVVSIERGWYRPTQARTPRVTVR